MADEETKPEPEAADAAANEAPPDEATVTDASTRAGEASSPDDAPPAEKAPTLPDAAPEEPTAAAAEGESPAEKAPTLPEVPPPIAAAGGGEPPAPGGAELPGA